MVGTVDEETQQENIIWLDMVLAIVFTFIWSFNIAASCRKENRTTYPLFIIIGLFLSLSSNYYFSSCAIFLIWKLFACSSAAFVRLADLFLQGQDAGLGPLLAALLRGALLLPDDRSPYPPFYLVRTAHIFIDTYRIEFYVEIKNIGFYNFQSKNTIKRVFIAICVLLITILFADTFVTFLKYFNIVSNLEGTMATFY